jgi:23S rRNA pseudouridine1911/1915/1917 synthase
MSNIGAPLWGDNRYGRGIPGQQIALWGYKLTFRHPTQGEIMTFHSMPEGSIWNAYADLLTVPEDTDTPKERPALVIREEVVQRLEEFDKYKPVKTDELL